MAILITGNSFGATDTVTSTKLNNIANNATFGTGAYDDVTINLTSGSLQVKDGGIGYATLSTGKPTWDVSSNVTVSHNLMVGNDATVTQNLTVNNTLTVGGAINASNAIATDLTLTANGGIITLGSAPLYAYSAGTTGSIRWSNTHIYVCVDTNTWKRVAIATF